MGVNGLSHIGLSVSDAARSLRFYTDALDFEEGVRHDLARDAAAPDKPPMPVICQFVHNANVQLALLQYDSPEKEAGIGPRPMKRIGIAALAVLVDSLDPVIKKVLANGGAIHHETYLEMPDGEIIHCSDPDGIRIELIRYSR